MLSAALERARRQQSARREVRRWAARVLMSARELGGPVSLADREASRAELDKNIASLEAGGVLEGGGESAADSGDAMTGAIQSMPLGHQLTRERMRLLARAWNATPADRRFHLGGGLAIRLDDGGPVRPLLELDEVEVERALQPPSSCRRSAGGAA